MADTVETPSTDQKEEKKYTNLDINMLKRMSFIRGVSVVERAMISAVIQEVVELADAASGDLCMTFERVPQKGDGSFVGVDMDSPDTRKVTDDMRGKECVRIYVCEDGSVVQTTNVIMSYHGLISLIGDFRGFAKFTLKKFDSEDTTGSDAGSAGGASTASTLSDKKDEDEYGF